MDESAVVPAGDPLISADSSSIWATAAGPAFRSQYTPMIAAIQTQNDATMPTPAARARETPKPP